MEIKAADIKKIITDISDKLEENIDYLTELDAKIGDGDHGINMSNGFKKIKKNLADNKTDDIGEILITTGKVLLNEIGGAMGPLYGGAFVRAGTTLKGKKNMDKKDVAVMFSDFLESIKSLGGAKIGDKTMVDTIEPFVAKLNCEIKSSELPDAFDSALMDAKRGMESTRDMVSNIGRSSRLLERSRGHLDVGAASSYLILETFGKHFRSL
jgi:dihydroxyacetone kinase-like protein